MSKASTLERLLSQPELGILSNGDPNLRSISNSSARHMNPLHSHLSENWSSDLLSSHHEEAFNMPLLEPVASRRRSTSQQPGAACVSSAGTESVTLMDMLLSPAPPDVLLPPVLSEYGGPMGQSMTQMSPKGRTRGEPSSWCVTDVHARTIEFSWTIENFSLSASSPGDSLQSDVFTLRPNDKTAWCLQVSPYGKSPDQKHFVSISLVNVRSDSARVPVRFSCSVLSEAGHTMCTSDSSRFHLLRPRMHVEFNNFCERDFLYNSPHRLIVNDTITFFAEVHYVERLENKAGQFSRRSSTVTDPTLSQDFIALYERGQMADVEIAVQGQTFSCHKAILGACSPVFNTMFTAPDREPITELELNDLDTETAHELFLYMYSRLPPKRLDKVARALLVAANKYDIERLKRLCEVAIVKQLTVNTACDSLVFGHLNSSSHVTSSALEFIIQNAAQITKSSGYETLSKEYPDMVSKIFCALAQRSSDSCERGSRKRKSSEQIERFS